MKVAVVIPCYNVEDYIEACLKAVFDQSHKDIEVICVDDGSSDQTVGVVTKLKQQYPLKLIQSKNQGACVARNQGVDQTEGEWIQFLDADDILLPQKISAQIERIKTADDHVGVVIGDYLNVYANKPSVPVEALQGYDWMALIKTQMGTTSANLWKRTAVLKAGGWCNNLRSSQDYELLFRLLQEGVRVEYDGLVNTHVFKRESGSISQTDKLENWNRYIELREDIRDYLVSQNGDFTAELEALDQYLFAAVRALSQYDLQLALKEYTRLISPGFKPIASAAISRRYISLYSIFGFRLTERLIRLAKPASA